MDLPSKVTLREVAPRDGFQSLPGFILTEQKIEIIEAVARAGVKEIEATSFVSPKAIPQMRDATDVMRGLPRSGCYYSALVPNLKGAQLAIEARVDNIVVVISASEAHSMANVRRGMKASIADLPAIFSAAKDQGVAVSGALAVAFGCPYQGDVPHEDVLALTEAYVENGAELIILADTTGMATPPRVESLIKSFKGRFAATDFALHFHNNRGTAMANLFAALGAGATIFDTALGGIGGCPNVPQAAGNLPTEDVVYMLEDMGIETGIDLVSIIEAARRLEEIIGHTLPGQLMKSGPRDPQLSAGGCILNPATA
ncbi:MAG: hydroxymethylglutaryl-CoA lyase [Desulfobacterales bacterium]|nr:hydroxymethylglutaryl-CoA lyase [Desulfobacterales bacterium]